MLNYDPVYMTYNNKPLAILNEMDNLTRQRENAQEIFRKRKRLPLILFLASLPLIILDLLFRLAGYQICIFTPVAVACWLGALVYKMSMEHGRMRALPPRFYSTHEIIHTLRDDIDPKGRFFGTLDLTGSEQESKIVGQAKNAMGLDVTLYRDTWLSLKTKLYDGNMLRFSASRRLKQRDRYSKRGQISGKIKWKPAKIKQDTQELKVMLTINPQVYVIVPNRYLKQGAALGPYSIRQVYISNGIIQLNAVSSAQEIKSGDILLILRAIYNILNRKEMA